MTEPFVVAAVEFNPELFEFDRNIERAVAVIAEAAEHGAKLIVLPECALSGYIYRDLEQFRPAMDSVPGRGTAAIEAVTRAHGCYVAIGIAECDPDTGLTYNTGALIGPDGYVGKYRKNGLNPSDVLWFTPGNTGYPVFDTELGRICMVICYDDTYWEPARVPAVHGADIIAYICASDRVFTELGPEAKANHSTIAAVQQLVAYNGLAMVAADRNNVESNPTTGVSVVYGGSASIWQADGERVGQLPATNENLTAANLGRILYGTLDPARFNNAQKASIGRRRPELYRELAFWKLPTDSQVAEPHQLSVSALQYELVAGDTAGNIARAHEQTSGLSGPGLIVLPAFSCTGEPTADQAAEWAEGQFGLSVQVLSEIAARTGRHVVGSHIERAGEDLFHTAVLVGPDGKLIGSYRQTHLEAGSQWASAGDDLTVFDTAIGRIGMLLGEDARFPEASAVLAVRRADLIAIPANWSGQWGGLLAEAEGLFAHGYPEHTMVLWYACAKTAQAYTVVANAAAGGSSGVYTLNPIDAEAPVVLAPGVGRVDLDIITQGSPDWWMNQAKLLTGRRVDLAVPLVLDTDSEAFRSWQQADGMLASWTAYQQ